MSNGTNRFRAPATQLRPVWMPDETQPDIFTFVLEFSHGVRKSWQVVAPKLPITEGWIRAALTHLIERITADLRYGHSLPEMTPDKRAFQEFARHDDAMVAALHDMILEWSKWRIGHYRSVSKPAESFREDETS